MKPESNKIIRNFTERNGYLKGEQYILEWGVFFTFGVYKLQVRLN